MKKDHYKILNQIRPFIRWNMSLETGMEMHQAKSKTCNVSWNYVKNLLGNEDSVNILPVLELFKKILQFHRYILICLLQNLAAEVYVSYIGIFYYVRQFYNTRNSSLFKV